MASEAAVNVQVVLRCRCARPQASISLRECGAVRPPHAQGAAAAARRPLNDEEKTEGTPAVVACNTATREMSVSQFMGGKRTAKTFTFDRVYGQYSTQEQLFNESVRGGLCGVGRGGAPQRVCAAGVVRQCA